ncbi:uncharacterized protein RHIMIDRAFT_242575 [Rhizopus microsporus ATCC 52813]|uniref:Uncharacterized protein n=1 Tax=Rhizopus microsporus ATCC 52813 TaxID=1340429 RepID=A0A2G4SFB7_RHIZD|nr:uncharacterized protein RHIMIDRAFT_242575 [Rhizopus microsporus ATCC 52813]PHZ07471.1 hypothetical protein RHIMIDRAFT_242575 [Rhizopus microsporus ATCC 52813]
MPTANNDMSVEAVLHAPTPSTSRTSAPIKAYKKYIKVVDHITQLVYAGSIFINYYVLELLEDGEELFMMAQNLFYSMFSIFDGQGKHASNSIKKSFKAFCESTSLTQPDLYKRASKGYMTIASSMAKQYETLIHNYKEMEQKKLSQETKPQGKAPSSYVHRKSQELPFVKKLNTSKYRSLKENTLTAINSNKPLEITSKLKNIDKKDIDAVQSFIKAVQARIQDKTFMPLKYTDPQGLRNVIITDGYAVFFMFKRAASIQGEPRREPKAPKGFTDIADDAEIWDVDPEHYHLCGYSLATRRRKEHQECHLDEFRYISELPTLKIANLTSFFLATSTRLQNYQRIHNYYCQDKWSQKLKFKVYINKQKGTQEIVKRLFENSKKYGTSSTVGAKNQNPNKSKHEPLPSADLPSSSQWKRIVALEDGPFCSSMKSK